MVVRWNYTTGNQLKNKYKINNPIGKQKMLRDLIKNSRIIEGHSEQFSLTKTYELKTSMSSNC